MGSPGPVPDVESAPWWDGLRRHRLLLQRCGACGRRRFPPMPTCPWCADTRAEVDEVAAQGRIYSWVVVHRALTEGQATEVPYTVAVVELEPGCRVVGRLHHAGAVSAGMVVHGEFVDHADWTELRFRAADDGAAT